MRTVDLKKQDGRIEHYAYADATRVVTGSVESNPHGVNHEASCTAEGWRTRDRDGTHCRWLVDQHFGAEGVAQIDALLQPRRDTGNG